MFYNDNEDYLETFVVNCQILTYYENIKNILLCGGRRMSSVRTIKFLYYTVCISKLEECGRTDPVHFDFESWIYKADELSIEKKTVEFDDIKIRLEKFVGDKNSGIWKLRFMKLRDTNIPSLVKEVEEAKPLELEDDEYIGEDLLMIYDSNNQVAMLQCNRFALGKGKLEKYLTRIWDIENENIILCPISKSVDARKLKKKNYRRLMLRFENIHSIEDNHRPFGKIVNSYNEMGGITGEVIISLGRSKKGESGLSQEQVPEMMNDIYENQDMISAAVLKVKDDDSTEVEVVNLFDNSLNSYVDFKLEKRMALDFDYATRLMIQEYNNKKEEINRLIS